MPITTMNDLFLHTLKDVYFAENAILKALPKMAKKAEAPQLKSAFETHLEETKGQVERLKQIFELLGEKASGEECPAIEGIIEESEELMSEIKDPYVLDAALIAAAQAVEHYEITRYGTLTAWAEELGLDEVVPILEETLEEEKATDVKLSALGETRLNKVAIDKCGKQGKAKASSSKK